MLLGLALMSIVSLGILLSNVYFIPVQTDEDPGIAYMRVGSWVMNAPYGQDIEAIEVYQNSSGSWVLIDTLFYEDPGLLEAPAGASIRINVFSWLNSTLVGAGSSAQGQLYQRHNATITLGDSPVYTLNNLTYDSVDTGIDPPMWLYEYIGILNYILLSGVYYDVNVTYDTYW